MDRLKTLKTMAMATTLTIGSLMATGGTEAQAAGPVRVVPRPTGPVRVGVQVRGPAYGHGWGYPGGWWRPAPYPGWYRPYPYPRPYPLPRPYPYPVPYPGGYFPWGF